MTKNAVTIRLEIKNDYREVENLIRESFPPKEKLKLKGQLF